MKILYLITNNSLADGIARHILNVASYFAQHRELCVDIAVCIAMGGGDFPEVLRKNGIKVYTLNVNNGHSIKILLRFHRIMKDFRPDIIHSHVPALMEKIYLRIFANDIPVVTTIHGITTADLYGEKKISFRQRTENVLNKIFAMNIKKQIYISQGVREFYHGNENSVCVYNPITFADVREKQYKLHQLIGVDSSTPIIGTACRISVPKNPTAFVRVMCAVLKSNIQVHAVVCGSFDDGFEEILKGIVARSGVGQRFHWLGYRKDAPELTKDLSCFIMTSITEGLPTALLEAMAVKVPVAFMENNGGLRDLADLNRNKGPIGIAVKTGEEEEMAEQIIKKLQNPQQLQDIAERAYSVGKSTFSIDNIAIQLKNVYENICSHNQYSSNT